MIITKILLGIAAGTVALIASVEQSPAPAPEVQPPQTQHHLPVGDVNRLADAFPR
jgi:hypothetical protein